MNRNEVIEAMAKAVAKGKGYEFNTSNSYDAYDQYYRDLVSPALSALEAIMERDGLKLLDENNGSDETVSDAPEWLVWKQAFSEAKCKLRGE